MFSVAHWRIAARRVAVMGPSTRLLTVLMAGIGLASCAAEYRDGPPAPIVQITPRAPEQDPAQDEATARTQESIPEPERAPPPEDEEPPKPVKRGTTVYAYKDPSAPPEPEPAASKPPQAAEKTALRPNTDQPEPPAKPETATPRTASRQPPPPAAYPAGKPASTTPPTAKPGEPAVARAEPPKPKPKPKPKPIGPSDAMPPSEARTPTGQQAAKTPKPAPASNVAAPTLPPAAKALASQAEQQRQAGDYTGAAASLERSLRIAPREPYLWNRLARVRMEQGQVVQAGNLASRSNDLAGKDGPVKQDNWRMIAESKRHAGDAAAANEAERRANAN